MKKLIKVNAFLVVIFIIFSMHEAKANKILPLPKPTVDQETKSKTAKKKEIYPKKKPKEISSEDNTIKIEEKVEDTVIEKSKELVFIYPKKKPLLVKKQIDKTVSKSTILSKKDFKIAKSAFAAIDKKKWQTALKISKKARDESLYNLINYLYLKKPSNGASFNDYKSFINKNNEFPRINRLKYLAEHKINLKINTPISIEKWFDGKEPLSAFGKIRLGEVYLSQGKIDEGSRLIKEGWIKARLLEVLLTIPMNIQRQLNLLTGSLTKLFVTLTKMTV